LSHTKIGVKVYRMDWLFTMFGGGDFSQSDCKVWLDSGKTLNPKTNRKIGPTQSGKGPYHELEKLCLEQGYTASKPVIAKETARIRVDQEGEPIIRKVAGRGAPAISATSVPIGTKKMGQDGNMYIIKARANGQYWQPCSQKTANC